jgi:alanine racemase
MADYLKRTWVEIDLDRLGQNLAAIRSRTREGCEIMAVVKADAYGHGAPLVAAEYERLGVRRFAVSNLEEAQQLRRGGVKSPVLILGFTPAEYAGELARGGIRQTVYDLDYARRLSKEAVAAGVKVEAHIKIDTGMSRIGFLYWDGADRERSLREIGEVAALPGLSLEGIFTHFAVADEPEKNYTAEQYGRFTRAVEDLGRAGIRFRYRHCCNSAALLEFPQMQLDMVRPGIILYGLTPAVGMPLPQGVELKPVMSIKTVISQVKELPAGVSVSYGRKYTTGGPTRVATLPIGYADGFQRSLSNKGHVLIHGRRAPVIGRVCMDQCMADVTGIPEAAAGDVATVVGRDGGAEITLDELAGQMGTINYEIACLIAKRVPRIYLRGGREVGVQDYILG